MSTNRKPLDAYLALQYPFRVEVDPDEGGYVIVFPDLPGCMTQVENLEEIPAAAEEIRRLWIETEYEAGADIPLPTAPETYSGKFNVRIPRSLHRTLAEAAEREGVSLNQYVVMLLARGDAQRQVERTLVSLAGELRDVRRRITGLTYHLTGLSGPGLSGRKEPRLRLVGDPVAA